MLAQSAMDGVLGSVVGTIERFSAFAPAACCGCQKGPRLRGASQHAGIEAGFARIFTIYPLPAGSSPEASAATQRGARLAHEQRFDEALSELLEAKQHAPRIHQVYSNIGCAYYMRGDSSSALAWYREAYRLAPREESNVLALALLEHRRGQAEEAQRLLAQFLQEVDSNNVEVLRQLGRLHQEEGQWSKAAGCFQKLLRIDPTSGEWPIQLQVCLDQLPGENGQRQVALPGVVAMALSLAEPFLRTPIVATSQAFALTDKPTPSSAGAAPRVNSRNFMAPAPLSPRYAMAAAVGAPPLGFPASPGQHVPSPSSAHTPAGTQLQDARRLRDAGRYDEALSLYEIVLRRDGRNPEALLGLADCHSDLGNFDAALEASKQLLCIRPDDSEANLRVAELLLSVGHDPDMVEPYLKRAEGGRAPPFRVLCTASESALLREDHTKALASASEAVRMDASSPRALMLLGAARLRVADYPAALRALGAALDATNNSSEPRRLRAVVHSLIAEAHERLRQYPQALEHCHRALELVPNLTAARVVRTMALHQSGQSREAEAELEDVLQHDPMHGPARLQLGYCQLSNGNPQAINTLETMASVSRAPRFVLGAAKVYLALAHDSHPERSGPQHADHCLKEGLQLHRNLQHVWRDIENEGSDQPLGAVQKLRGICDLDLTSGQAKQLLRLLARCSGRADIGRALASAAAPQSRGRGPSVPPQRRSSFANLDGSMRGAPSGASTPGGNGSGQSPWHFPGFPRGRGRSGSPGPPPQRFFGGGWGGGGSPEPLGKGPGPGPAQGPRPRVGGSRAQSPTPGGGASDSSLTISYHEWIRPEQLSFGPPLAAGGSAQVFRGTWQGQEVAIKKISGVAHLEEMKKEINALRQLRHPRLVRFMGACVQPPLLLVVTEFMCGGSLHDRLFGARRNPPLMPLQRWLISCQMVEGLAFLHSKRVVHRDLKSMNILLDAQQNAKICDFGLAQSMELSATSIPRKLDGEGGSPRYMAPECYDAVHGKLTEKVDIWAMGCILLELFGNILPYADCSTMAQLSGRILVERRPPDVPPAVPPAIAAVIRRCVAFDAARRWAAGELNNELARLRPN